MSGRDFFGCVLVFEGVRLSEKETHTHHAENHKRISKGESLKYSDEHHGKIQTRDLEMSTDPDPQCTTVLQYNMHSNGRNTAQPSISFCNSWNKFVGRKKPNNIHPRFGGFTKILVFDGAPFN